MNYGIRVRVWGELACFTRPEMKVERVTYDVMTPSAARGILEAIYWKPQIRWIVDRIHVLNLIRFTSVRRNEVAAKASVDNALTAMRRGSGDISLYVEDRRQQRAAIVLRDVDYVIEAHFAIVGGEDNPGKHLDQFNRRVAEGACYHRPYLGCREFPAAFAPLDEIPVSALEGEQDIGYILHDIDYDRDRQACFFRAMLRDGVLTVPPPLEAGEVRS
jgi:CRISPR-associated protein Cas5d